MSRKTVRLKIPLERNEAVLEAGKLLKELIEEDPRLKAAHERVQPNSVADEEIGENAVQIYRQRLRE
jgi:hypothetical protein